MHQISPPQSEQELLKRCEIISGKTINEIAILQNEKAPSNLTSAKGWMGQLLEYTLGANAKSKPEPDFIDIGVELKTIPISIDCKPLESTYICNINLSNIHTENWETSLVKKKISRVLWVPIIADPIIANRRIGAPLLWSPSISDWQTIQNDWQELTDLIAMGSVEEIHGALGTYLQVRPKAANSKSRCLGINKEGGSSQTLPRGFYLRALFTEKILKQHFL